MTIFYNMLFFNKILITHVNAGKRFIFFNKEQPVFITAKESVCCCRDKPAPAEQQAFRIELISGNANLNRISVKRINVFAGIFFKDFSLRTCSPEPGWVKISVAQHAGKAVQAALQLSVKSIESP